VALLLVAGLAAQQMQMPPTPAAAAASAPAHEPTVASIVRNPSDVPAPVGTRGPEVVRVQLTAQEVVAPLDPATGISYHYWTYNGKVPGPMLRVRVGDTVEVTLNNNPDNHLAHSLDFHAATGPGGGMGLSEIPPAQHGALSWGRTFTFVATTPGLFVYHCGTAMAAEHIANGMYGMILVEPAGGLPKVDKEYYVMQGEIYTSQPGKKGDVLSVDDAKILAETPQYFVFNGAIGALTAQFPLTAAVGQSVRIFFGNAGPNATSSPHVIGQIFTKYYAYGSLETPPAVGVQTATVPPGSAAIIELKEKMPGDYAFVDHALARVPKGLAATIRVSGTAVAHLMYAGADTVAGPVPPLAMTAEDAGEAFIAAASTAPAPMPLLTPVSNVAVATTKVTMKEMAFVPATIEIKAGQAVTWQNTSATLHTVVDDPHAALSQADIALPVGAAAFASPFMLSGQSFTKTFDQPGIYRYVCTQHERNGMIGTVIVKGAMVPVRIASTHHEKQ
jgi:nitrite reductase (NO-forming)